MNNYFIIGKVNEGKSHLFNLFSKNHRTISNPLENTTVDIIRKEISIKNFQYYLYDTPGFYNLSDFKEIYRRISDLKISNIKFIYLSEIFTEEDLKICKFINSLSINIYFFNDPLGTSKIIGIILIIFLGVLFIQNRFKT